MSWDNTYSHNLLYSLDIVGAVVFWNQRDVTISALCRIVQLADEEGYGSRAGAKWWPRLMSLNLWRWQLWVLRRLAPMLDRIQANHCEGARQADLARAAHITELLS